MNIFFSLFLWISRLFFSPYIKVSEEKRICVELVADQCSFSPGQISPIYRTSFFRSVRILHNINYTTNQWRTCTIHICSSLNVSKHQLPLEIYELSDALCQCINAAVLEEQKKQQQINKGRNCRSVPTSLGAFVSSSVTLNFSQDELLRISSTFFSQLGLINEQKRHLRNLIHLATKKREYSLHSKRS